MKFHKDLKQLLVSLLLVITAISCSSNSNEPTAPDNNEPTSATIKVLYTNDEHGWMEPADPYGGAAGLMGLWKDNEGYTADGPFLILSGGDMWTGPALSTWFEGESMAEVMNAMGYSAAAIGNHEVDFGIDKLTELSDNSNFPFLAANIVESGTTLSPSWCTKYLIKEVSGVTVGITGLTTLYMPGMVFPEHVAGLDFISYSTALNTVVPEMRAAGAEVLIVIAHMGSSEMRTITSLASQLGITIIGGGHNHELINEVSNGVTLVESGSKMHGYTKVEITYSFENENVESVSAEYVENKGGTPDPTIAGIVTSWQAQADAALTEVIGFANNEIGQSSDEMYNLITDSWLYSFPDADISISNRGGVRQAIPAGDITISSIVGVLPFDNEIIELEMTGSQLTQVVGAVISYNFVGGMTTIGGYALEDGSSISDTQIYKVLVTDYMYSTTSAYQQADPTPEYTYVNWRQPVIDYIESLNTNSSDPLDNYLDYTERQTPQLVFYF